MVGGSWCGARPGKAAVLRSNCRGRRRWLVRPFQGHRGRTWGPDGNGVLYDTIDRLPRAGLIMNRLLIIEDELPMRTALQDVLEGEGYRVITAAEGETGLRRALEEKPDLILLDVMMPRLDGYALCAELRRVANPVPVLMLTAKGHVEDRVRGLDVGADDYLVKPFSTEELLARVRALLRRVQRASRVLTTLKLGEVRVDFVQQ